MDTNTPRFTMMMMLWLKPDGATALATFRQKAASLFEKYDLRVERLLKISGKGQIVGQNLYEAPHLVQIISFPTAAQFQAYASDPQYLALAQQRDEGLSRMTVMAGMAVDVSAIATPGQGQLADRLYGVGLVRFKPGGSEGLDAFNLQAQPLFARHGMHVESMLAVKQTLTPVGEADNMQPERVIVFFLDHAAAMKAYATDPQYAELSPLRDTGLQSYDFFTGGMVLP